MKTSVNKRTYRGYEQIWKTSITTQRRGVNGTDEKHNTEIDDISDTVIDVNRDRDEDIEMEIQT